jgi:hypothetical protein
MTKKYILILLLFVAGASLLSLSSCQYNPCKARNVICENNGICMEGECVCIDSWEGDSCNIPANKKFESYYAVIRTELIDNNIIYDNDDTLRVTAGTFRNDITFVSIRDTATFTGWDAKVTGNMVNVTEQTVGSAAYYGSGSLNTDVLTITLFKNDPLNNVQSKTTYVGYKYETP